MDFKSRIQSSLIAGIVGDARGVPLSPDISEELSLVSVKNNLGYGRYDESEGTWSDDTALVLCTIEGLLDGFNLPEIGKLFTQWLFASYQTAHGYVYDCGLTSFVALDNLHSGRFSVTECGGKLEDDNGNGALMRILPAAIYFAHKPVDLFLESIHQIASITHAHPRNNIACGIYSLLIRELFYESQKEEALNKALAIAMEYYTARPIFKEELGHFMRILNGRITAVDQQEIVESGYVVDTLEAALWCFYHFNSTQQIITASIGLGLDTDTTGMIAGGLAGAYYGLDSIPPDWITTLARKNDLDTLIDRFAKVVPPCI